jgi:hypothetical protein
MTTTVSKVPTIVAPPPPATCTHHWAWILDGRQLRPPAHRYHADEFQVCARCGQLAHVLACGGPARWLLDPAQATQLRINLAAQDLWAIATETMHKFYPGHRPARDLQPPRPTMHASIEPIAEMKLAPTAEGHVLTFAGPWKSSQYLGTQLLGDPLLAGRNHRDTFRCTLTAAQLLALTDMCRAAAGDQSHTLGIHQPHTGRRSPAVRRRRPNTIPDL